MRATLLAATVLAALLAIEIDAPWQYIHDDNGAWTQAVASAHLRAGLGATRGQDFFVRRADDALVPYLHHPPLFSLVVAAVYALTDAHGVVATRAIAAACHLAALLGLARLAGILYPGDALRRALALVVFAVVPMSAFFGKMPFNEPLGLAFVTWACVATASFRARGEPRMLGTAVALWALACLSSWPAFAILFAIFGLFAAEWLLPRGGGTRTAGARVPDAHGVAEARAAAGARGATIALAATGAAMLALVLGHLAWAARGEITLFGAANHWGVHGLTPARFLRSIGKAFDLHRMYFANVPFVLALVWVARTLARLVRAPASVAPASRLIAAGWLGCALWALAFLQQITNHGYGQFWFLPFEALAAADAAAAAWRSLAPRPRLRAALATLAIAGTLVSSAITLQYRYSRTHSYAVRTAAEIERDFHTTP
jgi:hypothetical protein